MKIKKQEFNKLYKIACKDWQKKFREKFEFEFFSDELEFEDSFLSEIEIACTQEQLVIFKEIFKSWSKKEELFTITAYKQVCKALKEDEITDSCFGKLPHCDINKLVAFARLKQIERLYNGNWKANFDGNQNNYYPYFIKSKNSWGFCDCCFDSADSCSWAGLFKDSKTAEYIGKTFLKEIYLPLLKG